MIVTKEVIEAAKNTLMSMECEIEKHKDSIEAAKKLTKEHEGSIFILENKKKEYENFLSESGYGVDYPTKKGSKPWNGEIPANILNKERNEELMRP